MHSHGCRPTCKDGLVQQLKLMAKRAMPCMPTPQDLLRWPHQGFQAGVAVMDDRCCHHDHLHRCMWCLALNGMGNK